MHHLDFDPETGEIAPLKCGKYSYVDIAESMEENIDCVVCHEHMQARLLAQAIYNLGPDYSASLLQFGPTEWHVFKLNTKVPEKPDTGKKKRKRRA